MRTLRFAVAAIAAAGIAGCELTRSPTDFGIPDRVIVESILLAGDTTARVLIRTIPGDYNPFSPFGADLIPVTNATVRVVVDGDTVPLLADPAATTNECVIGGASPQTPAGELLGGCYVGLLPAPVASGAEYELIIDIPSVGHVTGRTVVPEPPLIATPAVDAEVVATIDFTRDLPFTVEWAGPTQRMNVEVNAVSLDSRCNAMAVSDVVSSFGIGLPPVTDGSNHTEPTVNVTCDGTVPAEIAGELIVTVYDTAYSRYFRAFSDNHRPVDAIAGMDGPVIGAFGSAASARRPVRFIPQQ